MNIILLGLVSRFKLASWAIDSSDLVLLYVFPAWTE